MKKTFKLLMLAGAMLWTGLSQAQTLVDIPDAGFRNVLKKTPGLESCFAGEKLDIDCNGVKNLYYLYASNNQIASLEGLQYFTGLTQLYCSRNQLTSLPQLPSGLVLLDCSNNQLTSLPQLPATLADLYCGNNQLTSLPSINNVSILVCYGNSLTCLPFISTQLSSISMDGGLCLPNAVTDTLRVFDKNGQNLPKVVCDANNPNNCQIYPHAKGRVYIDVDHDNQYTSGIDYPYVYKTFRSDLFFISTNLEGMYDIPFEKLNTDYTINYALPQGFVSNPASYTVNFASSDQIITGKDFIITAPVINDVSIAGAAMTPARPGFNTSFYLKVKNEGSSVQDAKVTFKTDSYLSFVQSSPTATVTGSDLTWDIAGLKPFEERSITVEFIVSATIPLNTFIKNNAYIDLLSGTDDQPVNNSAYVGHYVKGSFDPNEITVNKGNQVLRTEVQAQDDFIYTIHFQNTGTDTAFTVIVRDEISSQFDIKSLQTTAASHNYTLNVKNNTATWSFRKIFLADSTINKEGSNGFVQFRIKPLPTIPAGDSIKNKAAIYFDYNAPVMTNTATTKVSTTTDTKDEALYAVNINVYPNPSKGIVNVSLGDQEAQLQVISITGNIVYENIGSETAYIDLSKQERGIYFLKINTKDQSQVKKIILE